MLRYGMGVGLSVGLSKHHWLPSSPCMTAHMAPAHTHVLLYRAPAGRPDQQKAVFLVDTKVMLALRAATAAVMAAWIAGIALGGTSV